MATVSGSPAPRRATCRRIMPAPTSLPCPRAMRATAWLLPKRWHRGLPVVAARAGAVPSTVPPSAGILVPPDNVPALREALAALISDGGLRQTLSDAAWDHAQTLPRWADTGEDRCRCVAKGCPLSGFSPEWLLLREPADHRARDRGLVERLAAHLAGRESGQARRSRLRYGVQSARALPLPCPRGSIGGWWITIRRCWRPRARKSGIGEGGSPDISFETADLQPRSGASAGAGLRCGDGGGAVRSRSRKSGWRGSPPCWLAVAARSTRC